jgi:glycerol-3-phosphate acyltransferase PlsY
VNDDRVHGDVDGLAAAYVRLAAILVHAAWRMGRGSIVAANRYTGAERAAARSRTPAAQRVIRGTSMIAGIIVVAVAYLVGSISFAMVASRVFGLPDPHDYGSGNPGASNVLRTGHRKAALVTLVGDGIKGFVVVEAAILIAAAMALPGFVVPAAALAVFLGHLFPVYYGFRGGKGVATAAGIVFALNWPVGLVLAIVWLTLAFGFKISSLAGLVAAALMPLGMFYELGAVPVTFVMVVIAVLVFWRHRENIRKLVRGDERVIGRE